VRKPHGVMLCVYAKISHYARADLTVYLFDKSRFTFLRRSLFLVVAYDDDDDYCYDDDDDDVIE
jgi:hypothetical protein